MLHQCNPYAQEFKVAATLSDPAIPNIRLIINEHGVPDSRRYNAPTVSEIAGFVPGGEDAAEVERPNQGRDILIRYRDGGVLNISDLNRAYDPLHFVLIFPRGELGWGPGIMDASGRRQVTSRQFYAYRIQQRGREKCDNTLLKCGRLFQEYVVDQYVKTEHQRLTFLRTHQEHIRADLYQGLTDAIHAGDTDCRSIGTRIVLPSSFVGSPRQMHQSYQDAMAIVRKYGKPDIFITMTTNPAWPEITESLLPGQTAEDRPDITGRVFRLKLNALLARIKKDCVFGRVVADIFVVEFQKRGLPHAHLLICLHPADKLRTPADVDELVCCELPDKAAERLLHDKVVRHMMHGPCGNLDMSCPCMKNGECSKNYPRDFRAETVICDDSYPMYRRRDIEDRVITKKGKELDNRWVVPYNRCLLMEFDCHICVEYCSTIKAVKYLYKYVYKGHDRAEVTIETPGQIDELQEYTDGRYISAPEACYRLFGAAFKMHEENPAVYRLKVHLPDGQQRRFKATDDPRTVIQRPDPASTLMGMFELNERCERARQFLYPDLPKHFTWHQKERKWEPRRRHRKQPTIGRMYTAHPKEGERYYLRLLLNHIRGAKRFKDLRTVNGNPHDTFKAAAVAMGLLSDDTEWDRCMDDASLVSMPAQLRSLFASLLLFAEMSNPLALWNKYKDAMCEDLLYTAQQAGGSPLQLSPEMEHEALRQIDSELQQQNASLADFPGMPIPPAPAASPSTTLPDLIKRALAYDSAALSEKVACQVSILNDEQRRFYDEVLACHEDPDPTVGRAFFMDSPGGCGKTFMFNLLLSAIRTRKEVALAVASSGVASLLLEGGTTAHSRFKIPIPICADSVCQVNSV